MLDPRYGISFPKKRIGYRMSAVSSVRLHLFNRDAACHDSADALVSGDDERERGTSLAIDLSGCCCFKADAHPMPD